ncbi:hypothetical protein D3C80_1884180 [compost metagenome]
MIQYAHVFDFVKLEQVKCITARLLALILKALMLYFKRMKQSELRCVNNENCCGDRRRDYGHVYCIFSEQKAAGQRT